MIKAIKILTLSAFLLLSICLTAQENKSRIIDKLVFGGNLGLSFGTVTFIDLSPNIGYRFTEKFTAGVGIIYNYYSYSDKQYSYSTNIYGGKLFATHIISKDIFAHAEYEQLNLEAFDYTTFEKTRIWVTSILIGGGYRMRLGERTAVNLMILYNLNETEYSPYRNPIVRVGFNF